MTMTLSRVLVGAASLSLFAGLAQAEPVTVELKDGVITPQTIEITAGTATDLLIRNTGTTAAEFESKRLKQEQVVAPGAELTLSLPALPAGTYEFVEEFHEDQPAARGQIVAK